MKDPDENGPRGTRLQTDPARSALMGRVRQRGTQAERNVAAALRSMGSAYRLNVRALPGSPDFANRSRRWAIFVNGCFWHQHRGCRRATLPTRNRAFWCAKFAANRRRDARAVRALRRLRFRVLIVWECSSEDAASLRRRLARISAPPPAGATPSLRIS